MNYTDEEVRALVEAVIAYKKESGNQIPDYGHRMTLKKWVFETIEPFEEATK